MDESALAATIDACRTLIATRFPEPSHRGAAFRLDQPIVASICLHRMPDGEFRVLSPCGVCRERLATHGPNVLVAVADPADPGTPRWPALRDVLPHYWMTVFPEELPAWVS